MSYRKSRSDTHVICKSRTVKKCKIQNQYQLELELVGPHQTRGPSPDSFAEPMRSMGGWDERTGPVDSSMATGGGGADPAGAAGEAAPGRCAMVRRLSPIEVSDPSDRDLTLNRISVPRS